MVTASLEHIEEAFDIRIRISVRIFERIAHAGLGREMNDDRKAMLREQRLRGLPIGEVGLHEGEVGLAFEDIETRFFQRRIVIVVDAVETDNLAAGRQQTLRDVKADEAGGAGNQDRFVFHSLHRFCAHSRHNSMPSGFELRSSFILTSKTRPEPLINSFWIRGQPPSI